MSSKWKEVLSVSRAQRGMFCKCSLRRIFYVFFHLAKGCPIRSPSLPPSAAPGPSAHLSPAPGCGSGVKGQRQGFWAACPPQAHTSPASTNPEGAGFPYQVPLVWKWAPTAYLHSHPHSLCPTRARPRACKFCAGSTQRDPVGLQLKSVEQGMR